MLSKANHFKIYGQTAVIGGVVLAPYLLLLVWSFARNWRFPQIIPFDFDLRAWNYVFEPTSNVLESLLNSLFLAMVVSLIAVLIALPAARTLALEKFRFKRFVFFLLLLPLLAPSMVTAVGVHTLFLGYGLTDTWLGVISAHLIPTVPYTILLLIGGFSRLDTDFEAQARTLGANKWQTRRFVTFPAIAPSLAVAAVFAFLISWSQYLTTLFIGGGKIQTLPMTLVAFQRSSDESISSALTLVFVAPTLFVFGIAAKFMKEKE